LYSEKSISTCCFVLYSEKSISTCLFVLLAVGGKQKPGDRCLVSLTFFVVSDCIFPEFFGGV
jgi:hypothetical protein